MSLPPMWTVIGIIVVAYLVAAVVLDWRANGPGYKGERFDVQRGVWGRRR